MMANLNYDQLWFDLDNTIFDFKSSSKTAFYNLMSSLGTTPTAKMYDDYNIINKKVWAELELGIIEQYTVRSKRWELFFKSIDIEFPPLQANEIYLNNLADNALLIDGAIQLLDKVKDDFKVIAVTNGLKEVQKDRIKNAELEKYFEAVIISDEIGIAKPDIAFFDYAHDISGKCEKNRILMIGDTLSSDIQGAINFGIDSCWYNPEKKVSKDICATFEISKLDQLLGFIFI